MQPEPAEVAALLDRLMSSDWPTTQAETDAWLRDHDLRPAEVELVEFSRSVPGSQSWAARVLPEGLPSAGWHAFEGEFVGVHWFLWDGLEPNTVLRKAHRLVELLTVALGERVERLDGEKGFTCLWHNRGFTIDLYAHDGRVRPESLPEAPSVVQLHLDDTTRADAQEAVARLQPGATLPGPSRPGGEGDGTDR